MICLPSDDTAKSQWSKTIMRRYYIQLEGCQNPFEVRADENPTATGGRLEFKRSGEIVAVFAVSMVKGWWYNSG